MFHMAWIAIAWVADYGDDPLLVRHCTLHLPHDGVAVEEASPCQSTGELADHGASKALMLYVTLIAWSAGDGLAVVAADCWSERLPFAWALQATPGV